MKIKTMNNVIIITTSITKKNFETLKEYEPEAFKLYKDNEKTKEDFMVTFIPDYSYDDDETINNGIIFNKVAADTNELYVNVVSNIIETDLNEAIKNLLRPLKKLKQVEEQVEAAKIRMNEDLNDIEETIERH